MPGGGARGASTAAVRGSAGAGGISGCPAFGTAGCAPVTCVAGGFAGEGGAGDAETGSGVFVPAAEDGSAAFGAGVDLQDRTASQRSAALVRMDPRENGAGILRGGACTAHVGVAVCVAACAFSGSAIRMTWEMGEGRRDGLRRSAGRRAGDPPPAWRAGQLPRSWSPARIPTGSPRCTRSRSGACSRTPAQAVKEGRAVDEVTPRPEDPTALRLASSRRTLPRRERRCRSSRGTFRWASRRTWTAAWPAARGPYSWR